MDIYDVVVIGAGPGGLACAIKAKELGLSYVILEKGTSVFQGIIDSYPKGKKVYPTIPKAETGPFPIEDLEPSHEPVEEYVAKINACVEQHRIAIQLGEDLQDIVKEEKDFRVVTGQNYYRAFNVILAFGRNIPVDLGVYGDAKTVARRLDNPEDHIGASTLVLGGGNSAADIVAALSKAKRAAEDETPVYWAHRREQFKVDKDVARDLGEEILLGGNIRILQGAIPVIGDVDNDGVDRLLIGVRSVDYDDGMKLHKGMSFPMKHVIACIGTRGPAPVFARLGLRQEMVGKAGKETKRIVLTPGFQASIEGIYAIGAAISPAYVVIEEDGTLERQKHVDLIFTAVSDGVQAIEEIARRK
ncbi:MAG: pyridine nucleotide-disulfide oxidoreductase [Desulfobacterales bacterium S5133MH4]|nr:MAG: pyridine nucleotide-disulfide oxidoreductase [Desulfobacterales bacterium S5133MH4]